MAYVCKEISDEAELSAPYILYIYEEGCAYCHAVDRLLRYYPKDGLPIYRRKAKEGEVFPLWIVTDAEGKKIRLEGYYEIYEYIREVRNAGSKDTDPPTDLFRHQLGGTDDLSDGNYSGLTG